MLKPPRLALLGFLGVLAMGCSKQRVERAETEAQALATAAASARRRQPDRCPTVPAMRADGSLASTVATEDPWGTFFVITCSGAVITVTSPGPDRAIGTSDDIHATAVAASPTEPKPTFQRAPDPAPPTVVPAPVASPACRACNHDRMACLLRVQGGALVEGSEAFADPVEASKSECAFAYMACIQEIREKTGSPCPRL